MGHQKGATTITGMMIALSLWGCGEGHQKHSTGDGSQPQAAAESHEGHEHKEHKHEEHKHEGHEHKGHEHEGHEHEGHDAVTSHGGHGDHGHGAMEPFVIPEGEPVPTVAVEVEPDPMAGWNVQVKTENFTFAPEELKTPGDWNAGHAHLYLDGKKVARLYGPWFHLTGVKPGDRQLRVTLNTNDHRDLKAGDTVVEATVDFTVPES